jgi:hypothetical protein
VNGEVRGDEPAVAKNAHFSWARKMGSWNTVLSHAHSLDDTVATCHLLNIAAWIILLLSCWMVSRNIMYYLSVLTGSCKKHIFCKGLLSERRRAPAPRTPSWSGATAADRYPHTTHNTQHTMMLVLLKGQTIQWQLIAFGQIEIFTRVTLVTQLSTKSPSFAGRIAARAIIELLTQMRLELIITVLASFN